MMKGASMKKWIRSTALLTSLVASPWLMAADDSSTASPEQRLQIAVSQGLYDLYKNDLDAFSVVLVERPNGMFINGKADGVMQLSSLDDLGVSFLAENSGGRPMALTLGAWLPDVGIASDDEEEQQQREEQAPEKTWLDEETVLRKAYSGQIEGAQLVQFYVRTDKAQAFIDQRQLEPFLAYPPEASDEQDREPEQDAKTPILRPADATTEQNRAGEIREFDQGLLVLPSAQVRQANAVQAGIAEAVYVGGYR